MSFNSLEFLVYLVIVVGLFYLLPHKYRWIMLLLASYVFYAYFNFALIFLIVGTTTVSYFAGILIEKSKNNAVRKFWLVATLITSLGALFFFKYFNFLSLSVTAIINAFGGNVNDFVLNLILPIGISFYTFQTLSYVIDVYNENIEAERHFGYYALFVSYFPQLVAGPIERPENLLPQLKKEQKFNVENIKQGTKLMLLGFVKKVVVADVLSGIVNTVYASENVVLASGLSVILATALFVIQIYCDFSGYSDIATGCAKMMGVELMRNFNKPFQSTTISEFWSRWHISLSSWFNDYVYVPLNYRSLGKKHIKARIYCNLMIVFLLSGFWHGANWTFVVWGIYNGLCSITESLLQKPKQRFIEKHKINVNTKFHKFFGWFKTTAILALGLVLFRADSISEAGTLFWSMLTKWDGATIASSFAMLDLSLVKVLTTIFAVVLAYLLDGEVYLRGNDVRSGDNPTCVNVAYSTVIWTIAIAFLMLIASGQSSGFIYFQF